MARRGRRRALAAALLVVLLLLAAAVRAQDAGVVVPAGDAATSASAPADAAAVPITAPDPATTAPPPPAATETPVPTTAAPVPSTVTTTSPPTTSPPTTSPPTTSPPASAGSSSNPSADPSAGPSAGPDGSTSASADAGADDGTGPMSRAKLVVIVVLSAAGACVLLGLLGWCCTHQYRDRRPKAAAALPTAVLPGPDGGRGARFEAPAGPFGRSDSAAAMIAVMGDPVDDKRPSRLSLGLRASSRSGRPSLAPASRLSRPLGSSSSPSSLRGTAVPTDRHLLPSSSRDDSGGGFYYSTGGRSDAGSSSDGRASYSSLVEFHQSVRGGGEGVLTATGGFVRTSAARVPAAATSPSVAVLELHRFSSASSTASLSSRSASAQRLGLGPRSVVVLRDLTQPVAEPRDGRSSAGSSLSSATGDLLGDADSARLEWYNSIKSPADDDRYTRLSLEEESDAEGDSGRGDRQSYEL